MADVAHLQGSSAPGAAPEFMPITPESAPTPKSDTAFAGPDAELIALVAEAKVAFERSRVLGEQRDALCEPLSDQAAYEAAHNNWSTAQKAACAFLPRIAAIKATTPAGWMAKASIAIETPEELAEIRDNPEQNEVGGSAINESIIMDLAEALFTKQAEGVAHIPPAALDAPILNAWEKRQEVFKRYEAASDLAERHLNVYASTGSELAELFRPRETDFVGVTALIGKLPVDPNGFYTLRAVNVLRGIDASSPHCARAAEIVRSYDAYNTPSAEHLAADAALEAVLTELHSFDDAIRDTPALSLEGIGIKASWALAHTAKGERDLFEVLRQVEAFAHRHRKWARMHGVNVNALGGLPAADWGLYRLFIRWLESANEVRALEAEEEQAFRQHGDGSDAWRAAEARAHEEAVINEALRVGIVDMPAASLQGVRLKAHVYQWLCQTAEGGFEHLLAQARKGNPADDSVLAFAIARDMARLAPAACLGAGPADVSAPSEAPTFENFAAMDFEPWPADTSLPLDNEQWSEEFAIEGPQAVHQRLAYTICIKTKAELIERVRAMDANDSESVSKLYDSFVHTTKVLDCLRKYTDTAASRLLAAAAVVSIEQDSAQEQAA